MAYLNFITDTAEMNYSMDNIANIVFDYAENIFDEPELQKNHLEPHEIVTKINFADGNATVFRTSGSEICLE